jgi:hypothetical protein
MPVKAIFTTTRPSTDVPFYIADPDTAAVFVDLKNFTIGFDILNEMSSDGLVKTSTLVFKNREDVEKFRNHTTMLENRSTVETYNTKHNIIFETQMIIE